MYPSRETIDRWIEEYYSLPVAEIPEMPLQARVTASGDSYDVLDFVPYVVDERHQHSCGNCWVWASTAIMEVAHLVENDVYERLSIQFFNSNYSGGSGDDYACCGGYITDFRDFYNNVGYAIPWANGYELPVWIAAYGPKALQAAGEAGDGLVIQLADVDLVKYFSEQAIAGGKAANRRPYPAPWPGASCQCRWDRQA